MTNWARSIIRTSILFTTALEGCARYLGLRVRGKISTGERVAWLNRCCATALRRLSIDIQMEGAFPPRGLLVVNHLSYLDILVLSALSPCAFVAKKEVRSWPLFGLMAYMAGTVFVDRSRTVDAHRANAEVSQALADGVVVVLFPEGTSSDGSTVLPFRPALFEAAVAGGEYVTSAHISYVVDEGSVAMDVCYWGEMSFFPHLLNLLSKPKVEAQVRFSPEVRKFADRKQAAQTTWEEVIGLASRSQASARFATPNQSRPQNWNNAVL
jgi:lyso-ornithine lipid O-acyltransferase